MKRFALMLALTLLIFNPSTTPLQAFQDSAEKGAADQEEKQEKKSVNEFLQEAVGLLQDGELDEGLELLKKARKEYPDNMRVSGVLLQATQQVGMMKVNESRESANKYFYEAGKLARELAANDAIDEATRNMISVSLYNEACTYALDGKEDKVYESLKLAFENGFDDFELASTDSDFGDMLETKKYKDFLDEQKQAKERRKLEKIKKDIESFDAFDFEFDLETVNGEKLNKSGYAGKYMIVDIWGTWCPPCRREIPSFIKLQKKYQDKLVIVGLAYERIEEGDSEEDAKENVVKFIEDKGVNYPCAMGTRKIRNQIPDMLGYPTTLFFDKDGKVRYQATGFRTFEELENILKIMYELDD